MFARQVPASAILVDGQSMAGRQMPSDHQAAPAAFQADDIIPMNRSPDWHRGSSLCVEFGYRFTETCESLMNGRDHGRELVRRDLIAPKIGGVIFVASSRLTDAEGVSSGILGLPVEANK